MAGKAIKILINDNIQIQVSTATEIFQNYLEQTSIPQNSNFVDNRPSQPIN